MKSAWLLVLVVVCGFGGAIPLPAQNTNLVANALSPGAFAKFSLGLLYDQATVQVPSWGSGASGLQKRAEWRMAGLLGRSLTEYSAASLRGTDEGYLRCRCKGFIPRSRHVLVTEFTERRARGGFAAPVARLSGIAAGTVVASLGQHIGPGSAAQRAVLLVNTDIGFNMLNEFWPEIKRTLLLRHR